MEKKLQLHKSNAKAERDVKYRLAESKFHRKNERDRLIHERRQLNSNSDELKPLNDTYTVPEQEKGECYIRIRLIRLTKQLLKQFKT